MSRRKIIDRFTDLKVSRQRKYQLRKIAEGRCRVCGDPQDPHSADLCPKHIKKLHARKGLKSRSHISGRGRPPKKGCQDK